MTSDTEAQRFCTVLAEHLGLAVTPALGDHLVDDLGLDSLDLLELWTAFELATDTFLDPADLDEVETVSDAYGILLRAKRSVEATDG